MPEIVGSGLSGEAEETLFPAKTKRGGKEVAEKVAAVAAEDNLQRVVVPETTNMDIASPAHLWDLGNIHLKFKVRDFSEAAAMVGQAQEFFRNLEKGYADRLVEVEAIRNRITGAQIELLESLAEQAGDELPEDLEDLSQTAAKKLMKDLFTKLGEDRPARGRSSSGSRGRSSGGSGRYAKSRSSSRSSGSKFSGRRSSTRRASSGRKSSGEYDNDAPGGITAGQKRYLARLFKDADQDEPEDLEDFTFNMASETIQSLEDELGIEK